MFYYSFAETRVNMSGTIESGGFVPDFPSPHSRRSFRTLPHNFHQHQRPSSSSFAPDRLLTYIYQDNTNLRGRITVQLTFILISFESAALVRLNEQQFYLFGQIQTSQAAGQPYCDTSLCGEWSMLIYYSVLPETLYDYLNWGYCLGTIFGSSM